MRPLPCALPQHQSHAMTPPCMCPHACTANHTRCLGTCTMPCHFSGPRATVMGLSACAYRLSRCSARPRKAPESSLPRGLVQVEFFRMGGSQGWQASITSIIEKCSACACCTAGPGRYCRSGPPAGTLGLHRVFISPVMLVRTGQACMSSRKDALATCGDAAMWDGSASHAPGSIASQSLPPDNLSNLPNRAVMSFLTVIHQ